MYLSIPAVLGTMEQVAAGRKGTSLGVGSADWLQWVDAERILQLGMQTDAADEALALTRTVEPECFDEGQLRREVHNYKDRCRALF